MAKVTVILCDVKPCSQPAEREFEVNGKIIYACGESCFVKFWSREYANWKSAPYKMKTFHELAPSDYCPTSETPVVDIFRSDLHLVSPAIKVGVNRKTY